MKVAILHYGKPQWTEEQLLYFFNKKNVSVDLIEFNDLENVNFCKYDLILNRVYASIANENNFDFRKYISLLRKIEEEGLRLVNSSFASVCDYDKYISSQTMHKKQILNPLTEKVSSVKEIRSFISNNNGSVIVKPNTGGRGMDIMKFDTSLDVRDGLFDNLKSYSEDFIVQTLSKSIEPWDYRIFVCGEDILFANTRTLVDGWLGSRSKGSKIKVIQNLPEDLKKVAISATKAIGAEINSLDIVNTDEGYSVIENNPTPNFNSQYVEIFGFNPVEKIVDMLIGEIK